MEVLDEKGDFGFLTIQMTGIHFQITRIEYGGWS